MHLSTRSNPSTNRTRPLLHSCRPNFAQNGRRNSRDRATHRTTRLNLVRLRVSQEQKTRSITAFRKDTLLTLVQISSSTSTSLEAKSIFLGISPQDPTNSPKPPVGKYGTLIYEHIGNWTNVKPKTTGPWAPTFTQMEITCNRLITATHLGSSLHTDEIINSCPDPTQETIYVFLAFNLIAVSASGFSLVLGQLSVKARFRT